CGSEVAGRVAAVRADFRGDTGAEVAQGRPVQRFSLVSGHEAGRLLSSCCQICRDRWVVRLVGGRSLRHCALLRSGESSESAYPPLLPPVELVLPGAGRSVTGAGAGWSVQPKPSGAVRHSSAVDVEI